MYSIDTMTSLNLGEQGEHLANELRIDMSPWLEGTEGLKCYIYVLRHAETSAYIAATTMEDDNVLLWPVSSWDTAITGAGLASFVATDGTRIIRSKRIRTEVGTIIPGTDEDNIPEPMEAWRDELIAQITVIRNAAEAAQAGAETAQSNAETAQAAAEDARDKALGAQGAAEFAKENARIAQNEAEAARDRAVSAETAANNARDAAQGAQAAAEAAQSAAAESATAAKTSENNAKSSELIASVNQMSALNYSKSAKQSADKAQSQASMAETAKGLAFDEAERAGASARAATQSETNAAASASAASTSESNAAASASSAAQSASQASGSATQAGNSATAAAGSASQASQSATAAGQSARNAEDAAQDAQDVLDSIPEDYTALSNDVTALKSAVSDLESLDNAPAIIETASGAVASFDDGADDRPMRSLVAHIEPVQKGSGDPSPDNVRPITGWDAVNIVRSGANLLPVYAESMTQNGITYTANADGSVTVNGTATATNTYAAPFGAWVWDGVQDVWLSGCPTGGNYETGYSLRLEAQNSWSEPDIGNGVRLAGYSGSIIGRKLKFCIVIRNGTVCNNLVFKPMLNFGNSALPYEPYNGQTYSVEFPSEAGTVYGGTLDVTSGKLVVDRHYVSLANTSNVSYHTGNVPSLWLRFESGKNGNSSTSLNAISNMYPVGGNGYPRVAYYNSEVDIFDSRFTDEQTARSLLSDFICVYKLAIPVEYTLTPQEIKTILGQNNIWADIGNVDVTYQADTKLYIDNKFAELQAMILENIGG